MQILDIRFCMEVSDLAPLTALVNLQSLFMSLCNVSDLAPLTALVNLQSLYMGGCSAVSDLAPLTALVNLQVLVIRYCSTVSDLAPLSALPTAGWSHQLHGGVRGGGGGRDVKLRVKTRDQRVALAAREDVNAVHAEPRVLDLYDGRCISCANLCI
jgi:hypothetical protein